MLTGNEAARDFCMKVMRTSFCAYTGLSVSFRTMPVEIQNLGLHQWYREHADNAFWMKKFQARKLLTELSMRLKNW